MHYLPADFPLIHNSEVFPETNETFSSMNRGGQAEQTGQIKSGSLC